MKCGMGYTKPENRKHQRVAQSSDGQGLENLPGGVVASSDGGCLDISGWLLGRGYSKQEKGKAGETWGHENTNTCEIGLEVARPWA